MKGVKDFFLSVCLFVCFLKKLQSVHRTAENLNFPLFINNKSDSKAIILPKRVEKVIFVQGIKREMVYVNSAKENKC